MKNLIMGFGTNQTKESVDIFMKSAREAYSLEDTDIFLLTNSKNDIDEIMHENDINLFATSNIYNGSVDKNNRIANRIIVQSMCVAMNMFLGKNSKFYESYYSFLETYLHPHLARWFSYRRLVRIYNDYDMVVISDIRDVCFQSDVFHFREWEGVSVFQDGGGFGRETSNGQWYIDGYGEREYKSVNDNSPICVGVIIGKMGAICDMIERFCLEIAKSPFGKIEQAIFNYHFFNGHFANNVQSLPNLVQGVANLSSPAEYGDVIKLVDDRICLRDGSVIPIIHMYDRNEMTQALVDRLICPPLSGPETMIVWTMKGTLNAEQEAQAGRDHRQAA